MILDPSRVVALCLNPAHAGEIEQGRRLERRHRLHIEGTKDVFFQWLDEHYTFGTDNERKVMQCFGLPITKTKFGPFSDALSKVFSARGSSYYYEFRRPDQQQEFEHYLEQNKVLPKLQQRFAKVSLTGFQGVFLVDLPAEPNPADELPKPYIQYMPSSLVHDALIEDNAYEYIIFRQSRVVNDKEEAYYICYDEQTAYVVVPTGNADKYRIDSEKTVIHGLGYVPAFAPSLYSEKASEETIRTSIFDRALPIADDYQLDYNNRILSKYYHAFQKFWAFGVPCEWQWQVGYTDSCTGEACHTTAQCRGTGFAEVAGSLHACPKCKGAGKVIPVGPDKTFILEVPTGDNKFDMRDPAGYITPDVATWKQQGEDLKELASALEVAALSKEGITSTNTQRETAIAKQLDAAQVDGRRDDYGLSWLHVKKNCLETMARLQYGSDFLQASIIQGRKYDALSQDEQEERYDRSKKAGIADGILFGYLEDLIYTKYNNDPVELEYNRLKLYIEPVPTRSTSEVQQWYFQNPTEELWALFRRKRNFNDYIAQFERENGSLTQFGIRVSFEQRVEAIKQAFDLYDQELNTRFPYPSTVNPPTNVNNVSA